MRPVTLTLRAFGSYAGELRVDFARLAHHGIFSISGPTGAGKSTIFDALVYALYDGLPGFRVRGNVRSQFADPATETEVELDFDVHGERWRVVRRPTQLVARRRGAGALIERKSAVLLERVGPDGEAVPGTATTKNAEVARRIDELVGLSKDQFEQVVLIPQGRFEEVLKAETGRRAPLLRRLFPVEVFGRVTERLRSIAAARQAAFDDAGRTYGQIVDRLRGAYEVACEHAPAPCLGELQCLGELVGAGEAGAGEAGAGFDVERLPHYVDALGRAVTALDELDDAAVVDLEAARRRRDQARSALADWKEWQSKLALAASFAAEEGEDALEAALLGRARRLGDLRPVLHEWAQATRLLEQLEPRHAELVAAVEAGWAREGGPGSRITLDAGALAEARAASVLAARLAAEAGVLQMEVARFERLAASARSIGARRTVLVERQVALAERALKLDAEDEAVSLMSEEVERLRAGSGALGELAIGLEVLEREHQASQRRDALGAELARLERGLLQAAAESTSATDAANAARASWRDGVAGRLAELLADGEPCPTCGALEHPAPAVTLADAADDEALAAAEGVRDALLEAQRLLERQIAAADAEWRALEGARGLHEIEAELAAHRAALEAACDASERMAIVTAEEQRRSRALRERRDQLEVDGRSLEGDAAGVSFEESALEGDMAAFVVDHGAFAFPAPSVAACRAIGRDVESLAEVLSDAEAATSVLRQCEAVLAPVADELGAADPGDLLQWVVDAVELDARAATLQVRRTRREEIWRRIAQLEAGVGASDPPDLPALEAAVAVATRAHVALVEQRTQLSDKLSALERGVDALRSGRAGVETARCALERAKTVADQCAGLGAASAAVRLSLENWVLADYLRQVLVQANHRLDAMTDGRYELRLSEGVTDGRKPWGLDISVFDATTGQVRPATTLSGGETFMAALALALGLADVVSGGSNREIGALFVDEGFGSLDAQSLEAVIDVLRSLEDGGRIVGVISHVEDLKQALPTGITVQPSPNGSVATLHYPPD